MTSNERKIINFLRNAKEKTRIRLIAKKINFSNDYTQSLCHSLARAGYIKLEDSNICHLLKKSLGHFDSVAVMREISEPVVVTDNVILLTDESSGAPFASNRDDKAGDDTELDKALADLESSSQKDESEEKDKPKEIKDETENESGGLEEEKTEEIAEEPKEVLAETDPAPEQAQYGAEATEREKMEKPDEMELKPEPKAEEEKEKETAPEAEMKAATDMVDGKEEVKAENPEKAALKEEPAKPSIGFGANFKKIVNWFAEKK